MIPLYKKKHRKYLNILFCLFALLGPVSLWAIDADNDGSDATDEALAGTSDNNGGERPYWYKTLSGTDAGFGFSLSELGDVNKDGYVDWVVGEYWSDVNGDNAGAAYVISGATDAVLYTVLGDSPGDEFGYSVSGVGDVNNDGYPDWVVGARKDDDNGSACGSARVFSGANASILYTHYGDAAQDIFGYSVSGAGDVNGDGYDDWVVGAYLDDALKVNSGSATVFSGEDGSVLYLKSGNVVSSQFGYSVSGAGDINNDGYDDWVVGAPQDNQNGSSSGLAQVFSGVDGSLLYSITGDSAAEQFGSSVSDLGDINMDGYADWIVGADRDDINGSASGTARVFSGIDGSLLYERSGDGENDLFGGSVGGAGDVNGDGYLDWIVGARSNDANGSNSGMARIFSGKNGKAFFTFYGDGPTEHFGIAVSGIGDINNDGYAEFAIGATGFKNYARIFRFVDLANDVDGDYLVNSADLDDDGDGISDSDEINIYYTDPLNADIDEDGFIDSDELFVFGTDPNIFDDNNDGDSEPDSYDTDDDNDLMPDVWENTYGLNPLDATDAIEDVDFDGGINVWEFQNGFNPQIYDDADGDGSTAYEENLAGTNAADPDSRPSWKRTVDGFNDLDGYGRSVSAVGDVNNDGYADWIVGAYEDDTVDISAGSARVYSGLNGGILYSVFGDFYLDQLGWSVSSAGDVNNDGYDDWVAGAIKRATNGSRSGMARVYSGIDGSVLYTRYGNDSDDRLGWAVSGVGDVNNDGYDDWIAGAPYDEGIGYQSGSTYIYSGFDGSILYTHHGDYGSRFGSSASGLGDVNADGYDDWVVGATENAGFVRVHSGKDGVVLYTKYGDDSYDTLGFSVGSAGDVNSDGYADWLAGAPNGDTGNGFDSGYVKVFSGIDGSVVYTIIGDDINDRFGVSVSGGSDLNGDGYDDFVVGANGDDNNGSNAGSITVFSGLDASILYVANGDSAGDEFGGSVDIIGDADGDGYDDLIVGSLYDDNFATDGGSARIFLTADLMNDPDSDTLPNSIDTDDDNDGMPDDWENIYGLNPLIHDAAGNPDGDAYANVDEYNNGTDPTVADISVKDDFTDDGIAGWIWRGVSNGLEGYNRTWSPDWSSATPGWVPPLRTWPPNWDSSLEYDIETTGDFDGDGDADWLWRAQGNGDGRWKVWEIQDGFRVGQNNPANFDTAHDWIVVGAADTDLDGDDDIVLNNPATGVIMIWEMESLLVTNTHEVGTKTGFDVVRLGDFGGTGDSDLLLQKQGENVLRFWELESNSFVRERTTSQTGAGFFTQCTGDFNGDGYDDIYLLAADGTSKWFEYVNFIREQQKFGANQSAWDFLGCGDYDGDGDTDMIWTSADGNGTNKIFINQDFNNSATYYFNRYGGTNASNPGYGFEVRGNGN